MLKGAFVHLAWTPWLMLAAGELLAETPRTLDPLRTIKVARDDKPVNDPANPGAVISCVALHPDGKIIAAVGDDHIVRTFDLGDGRLLKSLPGHLGWVRCAAFSRDGKTLVTAGEDRKVLFWNTTTWQLAREVNGPLQVFCLAYSADADRFVAVGFDERLRFFGSGGQAGGELTCPDRDVRAVACSVDGKLLAAAGRNGKLTVWEGGKPAIEGKRADVRAIHALVFSPDGKWLVTGGDGELIQVWNSSSGKLRLSIRRQGKVRALAFCGPDLLAAGGADNKVHLWDLRRLEKLGADARQEETAQLVGHQGTVTSIVCDARQRILITGSYDTTIRIWQMDNIKPQAATEAPGKGSAGDASGGPRP